VVFIHGGLVEPERYHWLAAHLATRGWVSVLPESDLRLAIFEPGNGEVALDHLQQLAEHDEGLKGIVSPSSPVITMGHSLGGVLAARQWASDPGVDGLVLLASFPADGDPIEDAAVRPVLSLVGTTDGIDVERLETQLDRFAGEVVDARIDGMNHYAWCDNTTDAELAGDGDQRRPILSTRTDALRVLDTWLDVHVFEAEPVLLDGPFPGVELR
jgi:pimeloyl-ACP methyl ester carboxylesterase